MKKYNRYLIEQETKYYKIIWPDGRTMLLGSTGYPSEYRRKDPLVDVISISKPSHWKDKNSNI